jgi:hypothetical protein
MAAFRHWLGLPFPTDNGAVLGTFPINQSTDQVEWIFKPGTTDPITQVAIPVSGRTGTTTTWIATLQDVDGSTGFPNGTIKGGGSPASVTFTNASLANGTVGWLTLANPYTPANPNEDLALVVGYSSGTAPSGGVADLTLNVVNQSAARSGMPYQINNDNGVRTKNNNLPIFGYRTASATYGFPIQAAYATTFVSPNEVALRLQLPVGAGTSFTISKMRFIATMPAAAANSLIGRLYNGITVLQDTTAWDEEVISGTSARLFTAYFDESPLATLSHGSPYYLAVAQQTANAITMQGVTVNAAADMGGFNLGSNLYLATRAGTTWTEVPATRPYIEFFVEDWTAGVGGGGGFRRIDMGGGF